MHGLRRVVDYSLLLKHTIDSLYTLLYFHLMIAGHFAARHFSFVLLFKHYMLFEEATANASYVMYVILPYNL